MGPTRARDIHLGRTHPRFRARIRAHVRERASDTGRCVGFALFYLFYITYFFFDVGARVCRHNDMTTLSTDSYPNSQP